MSETKREKFLRLCEARTNKACDEIRKIGNLASRAQYEFTQADVDQFRNTVADHVSEVLLLFEEEFANIKRIAAKKAGEPDESKVVKGMSEAADFAEGNETEDTADKLKSRSDNAWPLRERQSQEASGEDTYKAVEYDVPGLDK